MNNLLFVESLDTFILKDSFFAQIPSVNSKMELFKNLSNSLNFPDYFGYNWDALLDLFLDFTWIEEKTIVIVHEDVTGLDVKDLSIYMMIVNDCIEVWKDGLEHILIFVFSKDDEERIVKTL